MLKKLRTWNPPAVIWHSGRGCSIGSRATESFYTEEDRFHAEKWNYSVSESGRDNSRII
jgi:hypothetical protein